MAVCVDPNDFQGLWNIEQTEGLDLIDPALIVRQADPRVSLSRELWAHLVSVSHHGDLAVDGGPSFEDTNDGKDLLLHIGAEGKGLGRVTYRVAGTTPEFILVERIDDQQA